METHYGSYYEYSMPTDKFTAYYDSHLKGDDKLHTFIPATRISKKLDEFISLSPEEQLENYEYDGMNICIHGIIQKAPMTDLYFHINRPMLLMKMTMISPSN